MNLDRIKKALAKEEGLGRRSVIRHRPDVAEVVVDCVLQRRPYLQIAKRLGVTITTLDRFRAKFITEEVKRLVLVEDRQAEAASVDAAVNEGQDEVQHGLRGIIKEQKEIYALIKAKIGEGRDVEDLAPALGQLLRDTGQSLERLLKSYTALKDRTTIVVPIQESPEWAKLQDVLFATFADHPEAFEVFKALSKEKRLRLG